MSTRMTAGSLILVTSLLSHSANALYYLEEKDFLMLPPHCKAVFASIHANGKGQGFKVKNPKKYNIDFWRKRIGKPWSPMNHYCPGLVSLQKAKLSTAKRTESLRHAKKNIEYFINSGKFSTSNRWLLAEAEMKMAEVAELSHDFSAATIHYQKSIEAYPKNHRAYLGFSRLLSNSGNNEQALTLIRQGLKKIPKSKALKRQEQRLLK